MSLSMLKGSGFLCIMILDAPSALVLSHLSFMIASFRSLTVTEFNTDIFFTGIKKADNNIREEFIKNR